MSSAVHEQRGSARAAPLYWFSAYFLSVAVLYLWGYWSSFNVNVLEFVGFSDVAKTAAYPIASVFVLTAVGALMGELFFPKGFLPAGGAPNTRAVLVLRRALPAVAFVYIVATVLYLSFGPLGKWRVAPVLLAVPVALSLGRTSILRAEFPSDRARSIALFLLAALPPFAYGHGVLKANALLSGDAYLYVSSEVSGHAMEPETSSANRPRYIGRAGEQYFLYIPAKKSVLVLAASEAKTLELHPREPATGQMPTGTVAKPASVRASARPER